jgi:hypothetical protein
MVDFKGGTNLVAADNIEMDVVNVKGRAYGLELSRLKKSEGRVRWSRVYLCKNIPEEPGQIQR